MAIVAVVAEFNPPHNGHGYLASEIRKKFGEDTAIIAIMSGNFVQRGDVAVTDKYTRARMALALGYNLVLEIPCPFSSASARDYAYSAVSIAHNLGCVDYLAFGSETGELTSLHEIADCISDSSFQASLSKMRADPAYAEYSHAQLTTKLLVSRLGEDAARLYTTPNNILAVSYLTALKKMESPILPFTVKRVGSYHDTDLDENGFASASALRECLYEGRLRDVAPFVPQEVHELLMQSFEKGLLPANIANIGASILVDLVRSAESDVQILFAESDLSLLHRIYDAAREAGDYASLVELVKAKHYTHAHVRRAILFAYLKVSPELLHDEVAFTALLAADALGRRVLKHSKKTRKIPVLTKVADYSTTFFGDARLQSHYNTYCDMVYLQTLPKPLPAANALRITPFIQK